MTVSLTKGHAPLIIQRAREKGLLRNELAYVLATSDWETNYTHEPVKEAYWLGESWRRKNLRYYPWYGRGFVQLTWKENYQRAQRELGIGTMLTDNPDNALEPGIAASILVEGMAEGWFTGKKLSDYITLQKSDFVNARRIVNGTDKATEIASLAIEYDKMLLDDINYGVENIEPEDLPDVDKPQMDTDKLSELIVGMAATIQELTDRVEELERWRKS